MYHITVSLKSCILSLCFRYLGKTRGNSWLKKVRQNVNPSTRSKSLVYKRLNKDLSQTLYSKYKPKLRGLVDFKKTLQKVKTKLKTLNKRKGILVKQGEQEKTRWYFCCTTCWAVQCSFCQFCWGSEAMDDDLFTWYVRCTFAVI